MTVTTKAPFFLEFDSIAAAACCEKSDECSTKANNGCGGDPSTSLYLAKSGGPHKCIGACGDLMPSGLFSDVPDLNGEGARRKVDAVEQ